MKKATKNKQTKIKKSCCVHDYYTPAISDRPWKLFIYLLLFIYLYLIILFI